MLKWLASLFKAPSPSGPPEVLRRFGIAERTLDGSAAVDADAWLVDAGQPQTVRLFEVENPGVEQCMLTYRARMKAEGLAGRAFQEMWCRFPGSGEFFSKGLQQPLSGTTEWTACEIPFYLKKGQKPDLIKLNVAVEGTGKVWIKDIALLKTPLGP